MKTVVIYGDSNTHGTLPIEVLGESKRIAKGQRYPDILAAELGAGVEVIAEGLPARTTVLDDPIDGPHLNGLTILPAILNTHKPIDLLVLMLGTNDIKHRMSARANEVANGVQRLVKEARNSETCADILIVAPVPIQEIGSLTEEFAGAEQRQIGTAEKLAQVAAAWGCGFFDAGTVAQVDPIDGVHMNAENIAKIGYGLAPVIRARLGL